GSAWARERPARRTRVNPYLNLRYVKPRKRGRRRGFRATAGNRLMLQVGGGHPPARATERAPNITALRRTNRRPTTAVTAGAAASAAAPRPGFAGQPAAAPLPGLAGGAVAPLVILDHL